jgi:hypothetical protein
MIAAGVNAKQLSVWCGHATIAVTLDLYGHLMPGSEAEGAPALGRFLDAADGSYAMAAGREARALL